MQKSILITGSSSGIGLTAAHLLQKRGYRVFATARKATDVKALQAQGLESLLLNVDDSNSIQAALDHILEQTQGTLYALFNNAGYGLTGSIEHLTRDAIRAQFETNVFGPLELIAKVLPIMRQQGYGRLIQNTSILGIVPMPYYGAYNASKFALEAASRTLRQECQGTPIYVSTLVPGPIISRFHENALAIHQKEIVKPHAQYAKLKNYFAKGHSYFMAKPDIVVKKLIHALESPRPKVHYYVGFPAHLFALLRRILCDSPLDWMMNNLSRVQK